MKTLGDDFCVDDDVCAQSDAAMTDMVNIRGGPNEATGYGYGFADNRSEFTSPVKS